MPKKESDWLLVKIDRMEDEDRPDSKQYRGEVLYKGELMWIIDADTEEELEQEAYAAKHKAQVMASSDDGDPDADLITFFSLE